MHTDELLRKKDAAADAEEQRRTQSFQKEFDRAQQLIADAMVSHIMCPCSHSVMFNDVCSVHAVGE